MSDQRDTVDHVGRLDPIDGNRVATEWSTSDAKKALFQEITSMPVNTVPDIDTEASRTTPRYATLIAAALALAVMVVTLPGLLSDSVSAAYAVRRLPDGMLEVTWDGELDGDALEATLREHDIDVHIETQPASPSLVGQVAGLGPQQYGAFEWGDTTSSFTIDPTTFTGTFYMLIMRTAEPGEPYATAADAFEPGEVLHEVACIAERPLRSNILAIHLDRLGQTPVWNILNGRTFDGDVPRGEVLHARAMDAETVEVTVRLDGDTTPADPSPYIENSDGAQTGSCQR